MLIPNTRFNKSCLQNFHHNRAVKLILYIKCNASSSNNLVENYTYYNFLKIGMLKKNHLIQQNTTHLITCQISSWGKISPQYVSWGAGQTNIKSTVTLTTHQYTFVSIKYLMSLYNILCVFSMSVYLKIYKQIL